MIVGSADIETLAKDAATIESFGKSEIVFEDVVCFQMTMEMRNQAREAITMALLKGSKASKITAPVSF